MGGYLFLAGLLGLSLYSAVRFFEVRHGKRVGEDVRRFLDRVSARLYRLFVFGEIPTAYRTWVLTALRAGTHRTVVFLVSLLRALERPLSRLNHRLRTPRVEVPARRDPSPFLKTIHEATKGNGKKTPDSVESDS